MFWRKRSLFCHPYDPKTTLEGQQEGPVMGRVSETGVETKKKKAKCLPIRRVVGHRQTLRQRDTHKMADGGGSGRRKATHNAALHLATFYTLLLLLLLLLVMMAHYFAPPLLFSSPFYSFFFFPPFCSSMPKHLFFL